MAKRAAGRTERQLHMLHGTIALLLITQLTVILWLIWRRTLHVPQWDEWELVNFFELADLGRLDLSAFWGFQNEHRIVLPRLILYALIAITGWQRQIIMVVNLTLALGNFALIFAAVRRTVGARTAALLGVPLALLLFSFAQFENWLFAFQTNFILAVCGIGMALWGLLPRTESEWVDRTFAVAIVGATIASLSTLAGLLTWVAFLPAVWWRGPRRLALWCAVALAIGIPYFNGFPGRVGSVTSLGDSARYALVYLGAPLGYPSVPLATAYGILGLTLLALVMSLSSQRGWLDARASTWLGLALLSLGSMVLTTAGRAASGVDQALTSRYQSFSTLLWVALLVMTAFALHNVLSRSVGTRRADSTPSQLAWGLVSLGFIVILGGGLLHANIYGLREGNSWLAHLQRNEGCIRHYDTASDQCLTMFYADATIARIHAAFLEQHRLSTFRTMPTTPDFVAPPRAGAALATLDRLDDKTVLQRVTIAKDTPLVVVGWALDSEAQRPAAAAYLLLDGRYTYRTEYGMARPDVAAAVGSASGDRVGFTATLPRGIATPGAHTLAIRIVTADGGAYADSGPLASFTVAATTTR
jgi:MFS family permease